ncbi:hypothetical protein H2201_000459 [Coniosporium apollinis]|uniref:Gamma interferon inducible lysosomal thiol reductase n=1 Tax=Coniosporium apollinis TaxID=61459 RepID=A0ABQ9PB49_9PEZI|nr:hypothetical protein H2201_000459 [Coniosporium apollinis]
MDEKTELPMPPPESTHRHVLRRYNAGRFHAAAFILVLALYWLVSSFQCQHEGHRAVPDTLTKNKVPLEAHIMSKCPDARDCLRDLILPTMQNASDKVDFTLSYIGKVYPHGDEVECKHGQGECLGNILELCAASLYPDPKIYLGFTMCLSNNYSLIPQRSFVTDCALEYGIDFDKLNDCMSKDDGSYGVGLLKESVQRSAEANVTYSCTVRLDNKVRCIRDGGRWKDCEGGSSVEALLKDIDELYNAS